MKPKTTKIHYITLALGFLWFLLAGAIFAFELLAQPSIEIVWTTETEVNTVGFNIYRSIDPNTSSSQINNQLIPSQGNSTKGYTYSFIDKTINSGQTYYYSLEEVEYNNSRKQYDIGPEKKPIVATWAILLATVCSLIGLLLSFSALKQGAN